MPPPPPTCAGSVPVTTNMPHPKALLLRKTVAVDVDSVLYFRDEHIHIQGLDKVNLTGTRGIAGPVVNWS